MHGIPPSFRHGFLQSLYQKHFPTPSTRSYSGSPNSLINPSWQSDLDRFYSLLSADALMGWREVEAIVRDYLVEERSFLYRIEVI